MKAKEVDSFAIEKRHQLLAVKEAVRNNTMEIEEANNILLDKVTTENSKLMKAIKGNRNNSVSRFMRRIMKLNAQLDLEFSTYVSHPDDVQKNYLGGSAAIPKRGLSPIKTRNEGLKESKSAIIKRNVEVSKSVVDL